MSIRLTEDEAKALGLAKDDKGNWSPRVQRNNSSKVSKLEPGSDKKPEVENGIQGGHEVCGAASYRIVVTAHCRRHTDPDNLCPKWFIDRLREFGVVPDDSSEHIEEFVKRVKKIEAWEPEVTKIEVFKL